MRPRGRWRLLLLIWSLGAWLVATPGPASAATPPVTIENVRVGFPAPGNQDEFEVGSWTPVWVDLKAGSSGFQGMMEVLVPDSDGTPTAVRRSASVPAGRMGTIATYVRPGRRDAEFGVRVYAEGNPRPVASLNMAPSGQALGPGQALLLSFGKASGIEDVPTAAGLGADPNAPALGQNSTIAVASVRIPNGVPGRWYGYSAAQTIVLNANDHAAVDALDGLKGEALKEWVHQGGHLVVALGEGWQSLADGPLASLLPATPKGRFLLNDPGALEAFASSKVPLMTAGVKMTVTQLEPVEALGGRALDVSVPSPLVVRGFYGFGRVTVVGLDVDRKPFADWADRKDFWVRVLDLRRQASDTTNVGLANGTMPGGFYQSAIIDLSGDLHSKLEQFAGVRLVPFAYVAGFVFLYILLIGPGDYFFLKKVLRRMEWTWLTFPLIVAAVSLLAYYAAYRIKGTELRVNKVDAIDIDQSGKRLQARGSTWLTLFSPRHRDYNLAITPVPLDSDPATSTPTTSRSEILMSYFGAPEGPFSMNSGGGLALASRPYVYGPADSLRALEGVRVPIWSTKAFLGRWSGDASPAVAADLQQAGPDRLSGNVTNLLPGRTLRGVVPGHGALLVVGKQFYDLGELKPNQVKPVGDLLPLILSTEVDRVRDKLPGYLPGYQPPGETMGQVTATELVFEAMFADSAGTSGARVVNLPLRYLDLTSQLALDRPMLVAAIDGPAASLDLGPEDPVSQSTQATVLRVILPPPAP